MLMLKEQFCFCPSLLPHNARSHCRSPSMVPPPSPCNLQSPTAHGTLAGRSPLGPMPSPSYLFLPPRTGSDVAFPCGDGVVPGKGQQGGHEGVRATHGQPYIHVATSAPPPGHAHRSFQACEGWAGDMGEGQHLASSPQGCQALRGHHLLCAHPGGGAEVTLQI